LTEAIGAPEALAGKRVFLAEDDPMILFVLEAVVEGLGCRVVGSAARVLDALMFLETNVVDIAVVDLTLADGHGDAVVAALAARRIPYIVTSGAPSSACGPNGGIFLHKPYTERDLHKALLDTVARPPLGLVRPT
jgi:ActR/RegA family two-component response regulator